MTETSNPSGPAVVVAEDDPTVLRFLTRALRRDGYHVLPAMDVREAMDYLLVPGVAAAVVDMLFVNSDGRSGLDLLRFIRTHAVLKNLPVIMLTGFTLNRTVVAEVEAHGAELWHKPIEVLQLVNGLKRLLHPPSPAGT